MYRHGRNDKLVEIISCRNRCFRWTCSGRLHGEHDLHEVPCNVFLDGRKPHDSSSNTMCCASLVWIDDCGGGSVGNFPIADVADAAVVAADTVAFDAVDDSSSAAWVEGKCLVLCVAIVGEDNCLARHDLLYCFGYHDHLLFPDFHHVLASESLKTRLVHCWRSVVAWSAVVHMGRAVLAYWHNHMVVDKESVFDGRIDQGNWLGDGVARDSVRRAYSGMVHGGAEGVYWRPDHVWWCALPQVPRWLYWIDRKPRWSAHPPHLALPNGLHENVFSCSTMFDLRLASCSIIWDLT